MLRVRVIRRPRKLDGRARVKKSGSKDETRNCIPMLSCHSQVGLLKRFALVGQCEQMAPTSRSQVE